MISERLARQLQAQGLEWTPKLYDYFMIPDVDLNDRVFVISDLTIDIESLDGHATIMFNGAVEWSLDYIHSQEAVWLPTESQLRDLLGDKLRSLTRADDGSWKCEVHVDSMSVVFSASDASDAYANALLHLLYADDPEAASLAADTADAAAPEPA